MNAFRGSRTLHVVALLALIAQLLLPMRHAAAMAHAGGNPLLVAFCGNASPLALQRLRDSAPPELMQALADKADAASRQAASGAACDFCAGLSAIQLAALPPAPPLLFLGFETEAAIPQADAPRISAAASRLPPSRGPPLIS